MHDSKYLKYYIFFLKDISDEVPYFPESEYEAVVPENIKVSRVFQKI